MTRKSERDLRQAIGDLREEQAPGEDVPRGAKRLYHKGDVPRELWGDRAAAWVYMLSGPGDDDVDESGGEPA